MARNLQPHANERRRGLAGLRAGVQRRLGRAGQAGLYTPVRGLSWRAGRRQGAGGVFFFGVVVCFFFGFFFFLFFFGWFFFFVFCCGFVLFCFVWFLGF